jgi:hypothetical protein
MKKIIITTIVFACVVVVAPSCSKSSSSDNAGGTNACSTITPKFAFDVQPIVASSCAVSSGCHGAGSTNNGGPYTSHAQIEAKKAAIKAAVQNGSMPIGSTLTQVQKNAIICWIDAGALNN